MFASAIHLPSTTLRRLSPLATNCAPPRHCPCRNFEFTTKLRGEWAAPWTAKTGTETAEGGSGGGGGGGGGGGSDGDGSGDDEGDLQTVDGKATIANTEAGWVIQGSIQGSNPLWERGLSGEGQVVGVIDTGLDENSCYFRHEASIVDKVARTTSFLRNDGPSSSDVLSQREIFSNPFYLDFDRRKVVSYVAWGDEWDTASGHGTHVAGTVAAMNVNGDTSHRGVAYAAKLAFIDIAQGEHLLPFPDKEPPFVASDPIFSDYYLRYNELSGAKISSASWGLDFTTYSTSPAYSILELSADAYLYENRDHLMLYGKRSATT